MTTQALAALVPEESRLPRPAGRDKRAFRADINALRAVAVVLVVLFHFGFPFVPGGYEGVDVFFVISGFLMSRIIADGLDRGGFSVWGFYLARARRIVPALLVMSGLVVLYAVAFVDPIAAAATARNALLAVLFLSNIQFAFVDGYFTEASDLNFMLHSWTLGVEWQFYILYPLVLLVLRRSRRLWRRRFELALASCLVLLGLTIWFCAQSAIHYQLGFFLLPTRAWELLAGGCVAFAPALRPSPGVARGLKAAGLALIVGSALTYTSVWPWPSAWTAVPVLGAVAYMAAGDIDIPILRWSPVQGLGTYSYSIYLWHWPIVVGLRYAYTALSPWLVAAGLAGTLAASVLSHRLVETRLAGALFPTREDAARPWRLPASGLAAWGGVAILCLVGWRSGGLEDARLARFDSRTRSVLADYAAAGADWVGHAPCAGREAAFGSGHICRLGDPGRTDVVVYGDSHVEQLLARYGAPGRIPPGQGVTFLYRNGCSPIPGVEDNLPGMDCGAFAKAATAFLERSRFRRVVIASAWTVYFQDRDGSPRLDAVCFSQADGSCRFARTPDEFTALIDAGFKRLGQAIAALRAPGRDVVVIGVNPVLGEDTAGTLYRKTFAAGRPAILPPIQVEGFAERYGLFSRDVAGAAADGGATLLDPLRFVCDAGRCPLYQDGKFLFKDGNHLRASMIVTDRYDYLDQAVLGSR